MLELCFWFTAVVYYYCVQSFGVYISVYITLYIECDPPKTDWAIELWSKVIICPNMICSYLMTNAYNCPLENQFSLTLLCSVRLARCLRWLIWFCSKLAAALWCFITSCTSTSNVKPRRRSRSSRNSTYGVFPIVISCIRLTGYAFESNEKWILSLLCLSRHTDLISTG